MKWLVKMSHCLICRPTSANIVGVNQLQCDTIGSAHREVRNTAIPPFTSLIISLKLLTRQKIIKPKLISHYFPRHKFSWLRE
jgi:hypothetical protein